MTPAENTNSVPTWHGEISGYFTKTDIDEMRKVRGFALDNYAFVVSHSPDIYQRVSLPSDDPRRMPLADYEDAWPPEKVARYLLWMDNNYPEGEPQAALQLMMAAKLVPGRQRKSLNSLLPDEVEKLAKAYTGIMNLGTDDLNGYFQNAAIHGLPLAFCQHHVPGFQPWHRVQLWAFENCLRAIPGCEDVTLPYWDFNELLPEWMYKAPFDSYTLPVDIGTTQDYYKKGSKTERDTAQKIFDNFRSVLSGYDSSSLQYYANAMKETWWDNFNGMINGTPNWTFMQGHDSGHDSTGPTMGRQNTSAFDPIFWMYHCNLDRMWWIWQANNNAQTVDGFMKKIQSTTSQSYPVFTNDALGKMNPWAQRPGGENLTARFTIELDKNFDVSYESMSLDLPQSYARKSMSLHMARTFSANDEEVAVRVAGVNRTKIPGTFKVYLLKDGAAIASSVFFQPDEVEKCANCMEVPLVHFDFRLPLHAIKGGQLSVRIEPNEKRLYGDTVPLKVLGEPTITVSLLMDAL